MSHVSVIGAGYVGLVTAACLAEQGHQVHCVEAVDQRVNALRQGELPIDEPGLQELWNKHLPSPALEVTGDYSEGLRGCDFVLICVGSPSLLNGGADLSQVLAAAHGIASSAQGRPVVVLKSTVPVGTAAMVDEIINARLSPDQRIEVVSNPEFLSEGNAIKDFRNPGRVIVGARDHSAAEKVASMYGPLECPILYCDNPTAEMIKYASNAFLATKISFINEVANLCERLGVDIDHVAHGIGMDHRIGPDFLGAGLGWGGSCLPKDTKALAAMARGVSVPTPVLSGAISVNAQQPMRVVDRLRTSLTRLEDSTVAVWGLTFKPDTDDLRESPALKLLQILVSEGCTVKAYDPVVSRRGLMPVDGVIYCSDPHAASR
ncbi:MAG: UDP-glucose dehydrogenase family protein, partial [Dehalococcoidia bacterium]